MSATPPIRQTVLAAALQQTATAIADLESQLAALADDQAGDTKSSAGDKFETSREMLQQDINVLEGQLAVVKGHWSRLDGASRAELGETIGLGSVVALSDGRRYLIATGLGKVVLPEGDLTYVISTESPLGAALVGRCIGDEFVWQGKVLRIG